MSHQALSADSIAFWQKLAGELEARLIEAATDKGLLETARPDLLKLAAAQSQMDRLKQLGLVSAPEPRSIREPDESALLPLDDKWYGLVVADLVNSWCGCPIFRRGWSGGMLVLVDEAGATG